MWWNRQLSKASVSREILSTLGHRIDIPPFQVFPSEDLDLLLVSAQTVVGVEIVLGEPDCSLSYTVLAHLERASYLLTAQYPRRALFLALFTNLQISPRSRQVLDELGVQLFAIAETRSDTVAISNLMRAVRVVPSARTTATLAGRGPKP